MCTTSIRCSRDRESTIPINSDSSSSIEDDDDMEVIDISNSNKFDINNHPNQNSVIDCDTNIKSVNIDVDQTSLEGADFLS